MRKKKRILFSIPFNFPVIYWKIVVLNTKIGRLCILLCYQLHPESSTSSSCWHFHFLISIFPPFFAKSMQKNFFFLRSSKNKAKKIDYRQIRKKQEDLFDGRVSDFFHLFSSLNKLAMITFRRLMLYAKQYFKLKGLESMNIMDDLLFISSRHEKCKFFNYIFLSWCLLQTEEHEILIE